MRLIMWGFHYVPQRIIATCTLGCFCEHGFGAKSSLFSLVNAHKVEVKRMLVLVLFLLIVGPVFVQEKVQTDSVYSFSQRPPNMEGCVGIWRLWIC